MGNDQTKSEKDIIQELIIKSEEAFEKKISYIGAGALLLSLTLLEKIFKLEQSTGMTFLILSWCLLIFSLLINFISHLIAKIHLRKAEQEIDSFLDMAVRNVNHKKRLIKMEGMNWISAIALVLGIVLILVFASINTVKTPNSSNLPEMDTLLIKIVSKNQVIMKSSTNEQPEKRERQNEGFSNPKPQIEKKGYTTPAPRQDSGQTKPPVENPNPKGKT